VNFNDIDDIDPDQASAELFGVGTNCGEDQLAVETLLAGELTVNAEPPVDVFDIF
jgi:hypothetical protein